MRSLRSCGAGHRRHICKTSRIRRFLSETALDCFRAKLMSVMHASWVQSGKSFLGLKAGQKMQRWGGFGVQLSRRMSRCVFGLKLAYVRTAQTKQLHVQLLSTHLVSTSEGLFHGVETRRPPCGPKCLLQTETSCIPLCSDTGTSSEISSHLQVVYVSSCCSVFAFILPGCFQFSFPVLPPPWT